MSFFSQELSRFSDFGKSGEMLHCLTTKTEAKVKSFEEKLGSEIKMTGFSRDTHLREMQIFSQLVNKIEFKLVARRIIFSDLLCNISRP